MVDQGQILQIKLSRFDCQPWGFRLQGGVDFAAPLLVQKVNAGSLAEQAGLLPGDSVLKINDVDVYNQRHKDAQDIVVRSGNNFVMTVQRGGSTWRPQVTPTGHLPHPNSNSPYLQTVTKTSLAHRPQEVHHIGSGYNNSARPFANGGDGSVKSIVNRQYNTPVGIYSDESIAETLSAQAEVLAGGVLGVNFKKNEKEYQADKSEVLKFLREEETGGDHTPAFNNHQYQEPQQHYHHQQQQQHHHQPQPHHQPSVTRHVSAPVNSPKPPSTGGLPTGQNICDECERLITGVFVRIKDKNLHVECFKCATCGTSLKNQGYYNFNNKLYCDIHAKLAAMQNPPPGTEGYVPVPIKPNTKLSASTISSALNAHGFSNGYSNGGSAPVNQGYARPFGSSPAAAAPKSPVSYPPQQQWGGQQQQAPKPAVNPYATLPRSNAGQQELPSPKPNNNATATLPRKPLNTPNQLAANLSGSNGNLTQNSSACQSPINQQYSAGADPDNATAMLTDSIGKINMGDKMNNFMTEAGKIISNMLEARLANNNGGSPLSNSGSTLSLRSNSSSNLSKSPMVVRKRFELDDFKDVDPTEPVSLKPVVAVQQQVNLSPHGVRSPLKNVNQSLTKDLGGANHPMGKVLDICDNREGRDSRSPLSIRKQSNVLNGGGQKSAFVAPPPQPAFVAPPPQPAFVATPAQPAFVPPVAPSSQPAFVGPTQTPTQSAFIPVTATPTQSTFVAPVAPPPMPYTTKPIPMPISTTAATPKLATEENNNWEMNKSDPSAPMQTVVLRNSGANNRRASRGGELSTHAFDRRSYIEPTHAPLVIPAQNDANQAPTANNVQDKDGPVFSISVKALGPNGDENPTMTAENEEVVNQLLKDGKRPICCQCNAEITKGPFITALGRIWCPDHFICVNGNCRRPLQDIGFVEEKGDLYCEYCFEKYLAPTCSNCAGKIKGDCLNAIGKHFHPECFTCAHCGKLFGNTPFFLEEGKAYCEADWNELFTTKCFACGFPVEAGDRWVEALNHNYHSQCFNCTFCKQNLEGQSFYNKGGRPFCKNHAR